VNSQPVKAEISVATPKSQTKEPIQLDIVIVCKKRCLFQVIAPSAEEAAEAARRKMDRLHAAGFNLSSNDQKMVLFGQLLTTVRSLSEVGCFAHAESGFEKNKYPEVATASQIGLEFQ